MKILISGFEPFGEHAINPTALLIEAIQNKKVTIPQEMLVESIVLPVTFEKSFDVLLKKIEELNPDVVLCFGLAAKRDSIEFERVAINCMDAYIPDNDGGQPRDLLIDQNGEAAYFSNLPIRDFEAALKLAKVPVRISNSAGTYVCNYVFYQLMKTNQNNHRKCGFVHVPSETAMDVAIMVQGLELMLQTLSF